MSLRRSPRALPALAATLVLAWLAAPRSLLGFTIAGPALGLDSRDFRVFDNFADPEANDNTIRDLAFPGYLGATLAIWKASVEWGSTLHGDGSGDPTQPFDLGSGGANFDASFQGRNTGPGAVGDNTHSAAVLGAGVIAITEVGNGGWRIRYNDAFVLDDGPGLPASAIDLQAVATHAYGHALGLGHTSVPGCVMSAALSPGSGRDLCADDAAGVQALYGAAAGDKPLVTAVFPGPGGTVTVLGQSFAPVANAVLFTQAGAGGDGTPVTVSGVASTSGGTAITVAFPVGAGSGDVLVRKPGASPASLSNAFPLDASGIAPTCGIGAYGQGLGGVHVATLASASTPAIGSVVVLDVAGFQLDTIAFVALASASAFQPAFGGTLLVDPASVFLFTAATLAGGAGSAPVAVPNKPGLVGVQVFVQAGQLDPSQPAGLALTNGLAIAICP